MNRKIFIAVLLMFVGVIAYVTIYNYFQSVPVLFTIKNVKEVTIKNSAGSVVHQETNPSNISVRIPKQTSVSVEFTGNDGYETGTRSYQIGKEKDTININAYYSEQVLAARAVTERDAVSASIGKVYPSVINQYGILAIHTYHYGEWASVELRRTGTRSESSDIFKTVLKKESGVWVIKAEPGLLFYEKDYRHVPLDILRAVNYS